MNSLKDNLKSGKTVVGASGSTNVENMLMLDGAGFDFILFDTQHSQVESKQLYTPIQALRGKKSTPLIRVSSNREDLICFALDAGARGIVVPMINTKEEASAMVRACRYSPLGDRSNAGERGDWGKTKNYRDYLDTVNKELLIIPMIETQQAIDNIDEILSVPGIDVLLIGPSDLSIELGVPLDYKCDTYQKGLDTISAACKKHGVVPGMYFIPPDMDPSFFVQKGFTFFTVRWPELAIKGLKEGLDQIK